AAPSQPAPQAAPSQQSEPSTLESLLAEFERSTSPAKPEPAAATQPAPAPEKKAPPDISALVKDEAAFREHLLNSPITDWENADLRSRMNAFGSLVQQMAIREKHREDSAKFDDLVSRGDRLLKEAGYAVGDDFVKRWFVAEANLTPGLAAAFDSRNSSV